MITVLGKLNDTIQFLGVPGFNVLALDGDWSFDRNIAFLEAAVTRGDHFLLVSVDAAGGIYGDELKCLVARLTQGGKRQTMRKYDEN